MRDDSGFSYHPFFSKKEIENFWFVEVKEESDMDHGRIDKARNDFIDYTEKSRNYISIKTSHEAFKEAILSHLPQR